MVDAVSWAEVADSAVKIGLGALIAGAVAVVSGRLADKRSQRSELNARVRDQLQDVSDRLDEFNAEVSLLWAETSNAIHARQNNTLTDEDRKALNEREGKVFAAFTLLGWCHTRLVLIGDFQSPKMLNTYRQTVDSFFKICHIDNPNCTADKILPYKDKIRKAKDAVLQSMSATYKSGHIDP